MTDGPGDARRTGPALEAMYGLVLRLVPTVDGFPRRRNFLLGDRIQATALDVMERLVEAMYTRGRGGLLAQANPGLEKLRFLFRLAFDPRLPAGDATSAFWNRRGRPRRRDAYSGRIGNAVRPARRAIERRSSAAAAAARRDIGRWRAWSRRGRSTSRGRNGRITRSG